MPESEGTVPSLSTFLAGCPQNWQKWGPDDEIGALNYLDDGAARRGAAAVKSGKVFTLQVRMGDPGGDPVWPQTGRTSTQRYNNMDKGYWLVGKGPQVPGGMEYADDHMSCFLHGTTHCDALGHFWYGDQLWNGYDPMGTIAGLDRVSIVPIAEHGIVGRGVLLDMARHRGKPALEMGEYFDHQDLLACAERQGVEIEKRSIVLIHTGWLAKFYDDRPSFYEAPEGAAWGYNEPGLVYSVELARWFQEAEIPNLVTDTLANEVTIDPASGIDSALHGAFIRDLGVTLTEIAWLKDLAEDCHEDGQYDFLYTAAPLKVVGGTGGPVNPVVIK
jgi:kynurenine formamidase